MARELFKRSAVNVAVAGALSLAAMLGVTGIANAIPPGQTSTGFGSTYGQALGSAFDQCDSNAGNVTGSGQLSDGRWYAVVTCQ
jgi:hypothetical protein